MKLIDAALLHHPDTAAGLDSGLMIPEIVCTHWSHLLSGDGSICIGWGDFDEAGKLEYTYAGAFIFNSGSHELVSNCLYIKNNSFSENRSPCYFWLADPTNNVGAELARTLRQSSLFSSTMMACKYLVWKIR